MSSISVSLSRSCSASGGIGSFSCGLSSSLLGGKSYALGPGISDWVSVVEERPLLLDFIEGVERPLPMRRLLSTPSLSLLWILLVPCGVRREALALG